MIRRGSHNREPKLLMMSRLNLLVGERRSAVVWLAVVSLVSGFSEAITLALIAEIAGAIVSGRKTEHVHVASLHLVLSVDTLILVAFVLSMVRLAMQIPISILPARIAADVQATMRTKLFQAFTGASWEVQSRDREGQLQDTMTTQTLQATGGAVGATNLISNSLNFFALLLTAFALNALAAGIILVTGVVMFVVLRPLKTIGVRRSRALSKAMVLYASGINEAIRVAEETQVFGVAGAQRMRIAALIQRAKELFFSAQLIAKLVPNLFQSLMYILLVAGLFVLHKGGGHHAASLGAIILLLVRSSRSGQNTWATYQSLSQTIPFIERTQKAEKRYLDSSPPEGHVPLQTVQTLAFEDVSYGYREDRQVLSGISFEVERGEVIGIIGPTGAGKSTLIQILLRLRVPQQGSYLVNGISAEELVRAIGTSASCTCPKNPVCCMPLWPKTFDSSASSRTMRWSTPPGWLTSTTRYWDGRTATTRSWALAPTRSRAARSNGCVSLVRSLPNRRCSCSTSPRARSTPTRRR